MEELIESICDYVRKPYTDYAVMLNGEWGSGKTYFWNNKLRNRLESIQVNGKNYKTIYMSLYGINSLEEISKKIFIETNPMLSKTLKKFVDTREGNRIPEYVKTGLDMANLFGSMNFNSDKVDFSKLFAIDDKILCFDDLERANVDVIDILGYINNFVEHDGIKTILICNEKELATKFKNNNMEMKTLIASYILDKEGNLVPKDKKVEENTKPLANILEDKITDIFDRANAYERIKEKLIGETFEYVPEYPYILNGMIMKYSYNEKLIDFYKRNSHLIIAAFKKSGTGNLRILKHALNDYEKIFTATLHDYPDIDYNILRTMLTFTIAMSFEIKAGNIIKEKLRLIKNNDEYNSIILTSRILNDNNQFYLREFDNRYFFNDSSGFKFFKFIEIYVRTRVFEEKVFKENLEEALNSFKDNKNNENRKYLRMLNDSYWKVSDFEFDSLWQQVLDEVRVGQVEFNQYVKLFIIFKYLMNMGLIKMPVSELKQIFTFGMQLAALNNIEDVDVLSANLDINVDYDTEDKDISEIKEKYISIRDKAIQEIASSKATELFKDLPNNISEFYRKIMNEYAEIPVFSRYDMDDLYGKLELTSNYDLYNIINMIQVRYKENKDLLKEDIKSLKKLADIIHKVKGQKEKTIKQALLENLAHTIEKL